MPRRGLGKKPGWFADVEAGLVTSLIHKPSQPVAQLNPFHQPDFAAIIQEVIRKIDQKKHHGDPAEKDKS